MRALKTCLFVAGCVSISVVAWASDPILIDAALTSDAALEQAAKETGKSAKAFHVVNLEDLTLGLGPIVKGEGSVSVCPAQQSSVATLMDKAQGALNYFEMEKAGTLLTQAREGLDCPTEPVSAVLRGKVLLYLGAIAAEQGDKAAASALFVKAKTAAPDLAWDPLLYEGAQELFMAAAPMTAVVPSIELQVVPPPSQHKAWLNGVPLGADQGAVKVPPGAHVLHLQDGDGYVAMGLDLKEGQAAAAVIALPVITGSVAQWVEQEPKALSVLLAELLGEGVLTHVVLPQAVWATTTGSGEWQLAGAKKDKTVAKKKEPEATIVAAGNDGAIVLPPAGAEAASQGTSQTPWKSLTYSGAALTGVGVLVGLIFRGQANATQREAAAAAELRTRDAWKDYGDLYVQWKKQKGMVTTGYVIAGASGALAGVGMLQMKTGNLSLAPGASGRPGVTVRWMGRRR